MLDARAFAGQGRNSIVTSNWLPPGARLSYTVYMANTSLPSIKRMLLEGLKAGGFTSRDAEWQAYHGGEALDLRDSQMADAPEGRLIVADVLGPALLTSSALSDFHNVMIIGDKLDGASDMRRVRSERLRHSSLTMNNQYWAVYLLDDSTVVSLGSPRGSSRLVAEILRAQVGHTFEERRVCAECGQLNPYRSAACQQCGARLVATGRLNRWIHYDNEDTIARTLTEEDRQKLADAKEKAEGGFAALTHPWKAETARRESDEVAKRLSDKNSTTARNPLVPRRRPSLAPRKPVPSSPEDTLAMTPEDEEERASRFPTIPRRPRLFPTGKQSDPGDEQDKKDESKTSD